MNTPATSLPKLQIEANYIGPIMVLKGTLSEKKQNLVFATNGTGKSFISRAFRILDLQPENLDPSDIVSKEGDIGKFILTEDGKEIAGLTLNTKGESEIRVSPDYIFHVFSSDYVETELKKKSFHELDGTTTHEIILGKPNVELKDKEEILEKKREAYKLQKEELSKLFEQAKFKVKNNFSITASLREFRNLTLKYLIASVSTETATLSQLKEQYEKIKSLPDGAEISDQPSVDACFLDPGSTLEVLHRTVTTSSIEAKVKQRIAENPEFFMTGIKKFEQDPDSCHFCTQKITSTALLAIDLYRQYFADEEAILQAQIDNIRVLIRGLKKEIALKGKAALAVQIAYDELKAYFPNLAKEALDDIGSQFDTLDQKLDTVLDLLDKKSTNLNEIPSTEWAETLPEVQTSIQSSMLANNKKISVLRKMLLKADDQKRSCQRDACNSLVQEFKEQHTKSMGELETLRLSGIQLADEIAELKQVSGEKVKARDKVASTFEHLLAYVFGDKYTFDSERFVVQRNKTDMSRGGDRTLSDGEKSVLGFCYFLAQTHLKVSRSEDYEKIFFVIDDPVSSVSFDYIYSIAQIIKSLRMKDTELLFDNSSSPKPRLLLLTHNDYFYNLASTNNVIHSTALFQLTDKTGSHVLNNQKQFVAPHVAHMKEVVVVANGTKTASHQTANSIRCVLEGMWRFCKPDLTDLSAFVSFVSTELEIEVKSMLLLNNLSHGAKMYSESTFETDLLVAAKEVMEVVEKLAPGQIKKIT